ncbi:2-amino-4-hydroxy-6-hydroxymethyldihydropteridine diphosphokinase [Deferribacter autotrophicus]|uniref:2-amino-4-hydroxy-6-hydroxymethyldihydropteridine pyrophosphokinase n=1 Tax=Deferribacter autotrophicus TaxID=500465 RepID=A0A5A8F7W6_9BACT|nr:2-amino-4-hydroxy-6-hydroxymethyldihydropteridine diphosphokinase [Deferribacter autotrophicus]KAA0258078.1 2-amino-4-hydroxy-6-hydroxymethyldihydropteridine diphosphokinase [Deferribacter autotrophicus]
MHKVILSIGTNLGDKLKNIYTSLLLLEKKLVQIEKISSVYRTKSLLLDDQPDYFNIVVEAETKLFQIELLDVCKEIEKKMGRTHTERWMPRIIDVDIIDFNRKVFITDELIIPHLQFHKRSFVVYPMKEICPDYIHPVSKKSLEYFIKKIECDLAIKRVGVLKWP